MADADLIAETNRLLQTILQNDAEQKARSVESMAKLEERRKEMDEKQAESTKARLREQGLPEEALEGTDKEWETRRKLAMARSQERIDESRQRQERYQDALLQEMKIQSDLLRRIAERLAR